MRSGLDNVNRPPRSSLDLGQDGPWIWIPPTRMILLAVLSINSIGDGLRDAIDPRRTQQ